MTVQTIPAIEEMTPLQRVELMEELWRVMSSHPDEVEPPAWHLEELKKRELAVANGEDEFVDFEVAIAELEERIEARRRAK